MRTKICLVLFFALLSGLNTFSQFMYWDYVDIITDEVESGVYPDMVIDGNGTIHISYWHRPNDKLIYAFKGVSDTAWTRETVNATGSNGFRSAIDVDSNNDPHIVFYQNNGQSVDVKYAYRNGPNTWSIESIPDISANGYGPYGPNQNLTVKPHASLDLLVDENDQPQIVFFGSYANWTLTCITRVYDLQLYQALKVNGVWMTKRFDDIPDLNKSCGPSVQCGAPNTNNPLPDGERYGEFCTILRRPGGKMETLTTGRFNNKIYRFETLGTDTTWAYSSVDSIFRALNCLAPDWWYWVQLYYSYEGVSAHLDDSGNIHMSYSSSINYGENFCCINPTNNLFYTRIEADTIIYYNFNQYNYFPYTNITSKGTDSIYLVYNHAYNMQFLMMESVDGGQTWVKDTLMAGVGNYYSPTTVYNDSLYVLMYNEVKEELVLGKRSQAGGAWNLEIVNDSKNYGQSMDAELEDAGSDTVVHIAYNEAYNEFLYYTYGSAGNNWNWNFELVDSASGNVKAVNFEFGPSGEPVIVYSGGAQSDLRMAVKSMGSWQYEIVDTAANVQYIHFVISANDTIHIAYYDDNNNCLKYAKRNFSGGAWEREFVDCGNQPVGQYPEIRVDAQEMPHISYYEGYKRQLSYAVKNFVTKAWEIDSVYKNGSSFAGEFTSLELDAAGKASIAFLDDFEHKVILAEENVFGLWDLTIIDSVGVTNVGKPLELEIDQYGNPWVMYNFYVNFPKGKLMRRDSVWNEVAVASTGRIANEFVFRIMGDDLYFPGKKNEPYDRGMAMLRSPDGVTVQMEKPLEFISPLGELTIFPNPGSGVFSVRFELKKKSTVDLSVYDLYGKKVLSILEPSDMQTGTHEFLVEAADITPGLYFCRMSDGQYSVTRKLMILK